MGTSKHGVLENPSIGYVHEILNVFRRFLYEIGKTKQI